MNEMNTPSPENTNESTGSQNTPPPIPNEISSEGKTIALIAYLTIIGFIVALVMNMDKKDSFASFHIRQVLGLALTGIAFYIIGLVPFLGWLVAMFGTLFLIVLWIIGLIAAINGQKKTVPILGDKYQEWFKGFQA